MTDAHEPADPHFERRVRTSFDRMGPMQLIGARLVYVAPGHVEIDLPRRADLTQQHGYFHGGIISAVADTAGGYAAYTLVPADSSMLTVEYKINLMAPGDGERLLVIGRVKKHGRTLTVCELEAQVIQGGTPKVVALGLQTLFTLQGKPDLFTAH
jgi:uncharacterized protein (TIGR00369 family)